MVAVLRTAAAVVEARDEARAVLDDERPRRHGVREGLRRHPERGISHDRADRRRRTNRPAVETARAVGRDQGPRAVERHAGRQHVRPRQEEPCALLDHDARARLERGGRRHLERRPCRERERGVVRNGERPHRRRAGIRRTEDEVPLLHHEARVSRIRRGDVERARSVLREGRRPAVDDLHDGRGPGRRRDAGVVADVDPAAAAAGELDVRLSEADQGTVVRRGLVQNDRPRIVRLVRREVVGGGCVRVEIEGYGVAGDAYEIRDLHAEHVVLPELRRVERDFRVSGALVGEGIHVLDRGRVERAECECCAVVAGICRGGGGNLDQVGGEDALQPCAVRDAGAGHGAAGREVVRRAHAAEIGRLVGGDPYASLFRCAHARVEAHAAGTGRKAARHALVDHLLGCGRGVAVHVVAVVGGDLDARGRRTRHRRADVHAVHERAGVPGGEVGERDGVVDPHGTCA